MKASHGCRLFYVHSVLLGVAMALPAPQQAPVPVFEGDLAQFNASLPKLIDRAALKWKRPAHGLDAETRQLEEDAAQCARLCPDAVAALSQADLQQLIHGRNQSKWLACQGPVVHGTLRQYDHATERGVVYMIATDGRPWGSAKSFEMKVMMTSLPGDKCDRRFV